MFDGKNHHCPSIFYNGFLYIAIRYFYLGMMKRLYFTVSFILEDMRYENKQNKCYA